MTARGSPEIVLDLSRLVSRIRHPTPTGVDRVEMAYARELMRRIPDRLHFGLLHPAGVYGRIPPETAAAFLSATEHAWENGIETRGAIELLGSLLQLRPRRDHAPAGPRVVVQSSPHHLHREATLRRILAREGAKFVVLIHDLIPIDFPEYARRGGRALHETRMRTVATLADAVVANSAATLRAFDRFRADAGRDTVTAVAHLGTDVRLPVSPPASDPRPYFVCVGTIEPRKNHLLLLHLWRQLADELGAASVPRLVVIGRRGWENEQVVDLLERCPSLVDCVDERGRLSDGEVRRLIGDARALLLPSFAEGFGMPVPEALALGTPVICSDLPALREAGGDVPCYLDPLDGPAWRRAVLGYADPASAERRAQLDRLARWTPPSWAEHVAAVLALADRIA